MGNPLHIKTKLKIWYYSEYCDLWWLFLRNDVFVGLNFHHNWMFLLILCYFTDNPNKNFSHPKMIKTSEMGCNLFFGKNRIWKRIFLAKLVESCCIGWDKHQTLSIWLQFHKWNFSILLPKHVTEQQIYSACREKCKFCFKY